MLFRQKKPRPRGWRRVLRWLLRSSEALILLVALLIGGVIYLAANLDRPSISQPITDYLRQNFHLELSYESLRASPLSDILGRNLKLASPPAFRSVTPDILSIGQLEVHWDPGTAVTQNLSIREVTLRDVTLTVVVDEKGNTSLDALLGPDDPDAPSTPLSQALAPIPGGLRLGRLSFERLRLTLIELEAGQVARRTDLTGLELRGQARPGADGRPSIELTLTSPAGGETRLELRETTATGEKLRELAARLTGKATLNGPTAGLSIDLDLVQQSLLEAPLPAGALLDLDATLTFAPEARRSRLSIRRLATLEQGFTTTLEADLLDRDGGGVSVVATEGEMRLELGRWLPLFPLPAGMRLDGGSLDGSLKELELGGDFLPVAGTIELRSTLNGLAWADGPMNATLDRLEPRLTARITGPLTADLTGDLRGGRLRYRDGQTAADLEALTTTMRCEDLELSLTDPAASRGRLVLGFSARGLEALAAGYRVAKTDLRVDLVSRLTGAPPYAIDGSARLSSLSVGEAAGPPVDLSGTALVFSLADVRIDPAGAARSTGDLRLEVIHPSFGARTKLRQASGTLTFEIDSRGDDLGPAAPLLASLLPPGDTVDWHRLGFTLRSSGTLSGLAGPGPLIIDQTTRLEANGLHYTRPDLRFSAPALRLEAGFKGTTDVHRARLTLALPAWQVNALKSRDPISVELDAVNDLRRPKVALQVRGRGTNRSSLFGRLDLDFDPGQRRLRYDAGVSVDRFPMAAELLRAVDPALHTIEGQQFSLEAKSRGTLTSLVERFEGGISPVLADHYERRASGELGLELKLGGLRYQGDDMRAAMPALELKGQAGLKKGAIDGELDLRLPSLELLIGTDRVALDGTTHHLALSSSGPLESGELTIGWQGRAERLTQTYGPMYPPMDVRLEARARVARLSAVRVERLLVESTRAGSRLELTAAMDQAPGRPAPIEGLEIEDDLVTQIPGGQSVAVAGTLRQALENLDGDPARFTGRGVVEMPFRLESPDHALFRLASTLRFTDVALRMPGHRLEIDGLNGRFQLEEAVRLSEGGYRLLPRAEGNAYARVSFPDTQPFISGESYFSIERLEAAGERLGPIAGNLRIDHNTLRLDQMQLGYREGTVTGQLLLDYVEGDSRALFRGNASGLKLTAARERLDANLALQFSLDKLDLNGQAHLVQVGRQTLLEALDLYDPARQDVSTNRVRQGLAVGYPRYVRLRFDHGFMSAKVDLGGLAKGVRIDEIRGIATGPLLNRYVGEWLPKPASPGGQ